MMKRILIADCEDSFVYNLVELIRRRKDCRVEVLDVKYCASIDLERYDAVLLSPGPNVPNEVEGLMNLIQRAYKKVPVFGVCLGMQALALFFGGQLVQLKRPLHGHADYLRLSQEASILFEGFDLTSPIGRYHSWSVDEEAFPDELKILAYSVDDNTIQAMAHRTLPIYAVQFHPESYLSPNGAKLVNNWLDALDF